MKWHLLRQQGACCCRGRWCAQASNLLWESPRLQVVCPAPVLQTCRQASRLLGFVLVWGCSTDVMAGMLWRWLAGAAAGSPANLLSAVSNLSGGMRTLAEPQAAALHVCCREFYMVQRVNAPPNSDGKVSVAWLKGPGADGLYRRSTEVGVCGPAAGHLQRANTACSSQLGWHLHSGHCRHAAVWTCPKHLFTHGMQFWVTYLSL